VLAQDFWDNDMSGMEPILIGAALGAGTSGIMGGDPIKGALMGAAGGGISSGLGGVGAAAQTGANTAAAPLAGVAGDTATQTINAAMIESGTSGLLGDVVEQAALSGLEYSSSPFIAGAQHLMRQPGTTMAAMLPGGSSDALSKMASMGGQIPGGQQQQPAMAAPRMRQGQAPQTSAPIDELMRMQMMAQRQRRPISLL